MRSLLLLSAVLLPASPEEAPGAKSSRLEVRTDPRVELLSIVLRLAGNPEYLRAADCEYVRAVEAHFRPFGTHEVVRLVLQLRRRTGISYDAPQSLAAHLSRTPALELSVPLEPWPEGLDARWMSSDLPAFLEKLRAFAVESRFFEFFAS